MAIAALKEAKVPVIVIAVICFLVGLGIGWVIKPAPAPAKPTLIVIGPWAGPEMEKYKPVLEAAEEALGIEIEYRIYRAEDLGAILPSQFEAEMTPGDVIHWCWPVAIREMAEKGHLTDLSDIVDTTKYPEAVIKAVTVDGKIYAAPYTYKVKPGFWYRKSKFTEWGITEEPKNWKEFVDLLNTLRTKLGRNDVIASGNGVGWPLSDITEHFILYKAGKDAFEKLKTGEQRFTDPPVEDAFGPETTEGTLSWLIAQGYFSEPKDWTTIMEDWWDGKYGLYFMGSWILGMVDDPEDLGLIPLTAFEDSASKAIVGCFPDYVIVPKYTKYPELAKQLAAFLSGVEGQTIQVEQGGHVASHKDVSLDAYPAADRALAEEISGMDVVFDLDDTVGGVFQTTFWDQLKYLWAHPEEWETCLNNIQSALEEQLGA